MIYNVIVFVTPEIPAGACPIEGCEGLCNHANRGPNQENIKFMVWAYEDSIPNVENEAARDLIKDIRARITIAQLRQQHSDGNGG